MQTEQLKYHGFTISIALISSVRCEYVPHLYKNQTDGCGEQIQPNMHGCFVLNKFYSFAQMLIRLDFFLFAHSVEGLFKCSKDETAFRGVKLMYRSRSSKVLSMVKA